MLLAWLEGLPSLVADPIELLLESLEVSLVAKAIKVELPWARSLSSSPAALGVIALLELAMLASSFDKQASLEF